ncbi:uncharacterized protein LOC121289661 [Carcharodon carcharias]|uniref:uncharacterized protein LOC121289661 n=1 Tax=Carcharodon carcharias TaxID=13397 RepID=UPI001B7F282C|nr:uncharacterized protein LOC121289661 [Carcharodon carcharias]
MTIYFRSDSSVTRRGFAANYSSLPNNDGGSCGGYLDAAYGSILSPKYPFPYPNNAQCSWYIRGDRNQIIKLQFTYVELEYTSGCSYDYIAIYDGPTTNSVLLLKFCNGSDEIFTSSSNSMTIYFRSDSSVTRRGFAANYSSLPNNDETFTTPTSGGTCGGYLDAAYGSVISPNYPSPYPNDAQCTWYIRGRRNQIIKLEFTYIELEYTSGCSYDYIAIYDGPTTNSVLLSKFCNGSDEIFISSSSSMTIYFRSDSSVTRRGFAANYSSLPNNDGGSCGGYLDAAYGSILSPKYPFPYPNNAQCSWYIRGDRNQIIKLQFTYVELEYTSGCSYDYIAIYDGPTTNSVLLLKFCNGSDEIFTSSSNSMTIYFRSDSSVTRRGFAANYSSLPNNDETFTTPTSGGTCGGYLDAAYGSVISPNYPSPYPNDAQCTWYIRGRRNQIIKLEFTYIELEYTSGCSYDYIAIYDGPTTNSVLLSKFCNGSDEIFISSSSSMTIYFRSDSSVTRRGFAANYSSLPNNDGGSCGGYLDAAYGSILSPKYPFPYPNNAQCSWYIRGDRNQIIKLQFTYVELEYTSGCSYDYIAIYDGPTTNSVLLLKFCNGSDEIFTSSSNSMTIYFRSDSSVTRRGFAANYSSLPNNDETFTTPTSGGTCGGYLDAAYGSVISPNYPSPYPNDAQCTWYIRGRRNQIIKLEFTYIELEYTSGCSYDYIAIYDGPTTNSVLLSKFCNGSDEIFISSSSSMTIYFRSDSSVTRRGFAANYSSLPNNDGGSCGGYLDAAYGSILSPKYPFPYPNNAQCSWYIRGDRNQIIKLQFTYVELEYTSGCSYDYIAIYDGPTTNSVLLLKFCNGSDEIFTSSSNSMTIYFRSDSSVTRRGFAANYSSLPNNDETFTTPTSGGTCGGYLDAAYGSVISPNYPSPYPNDAQCTWYIRGRRNQIIKLEFTYIELEYTSGCSYDYIAIYDGPTTNSVLLSKFCNGSDEIFISSSSSMTIYFRSDSSVTRRGFAANYSSLPNNDGGSCGGYLDAAYGSILSPKYPFPYPNNAQCSWYIRGDRNQIIKLQFTYVELEYTSGCSYDYIAIYDGPTTNSVLLLKFCNGSDEIFTSSSNSMTIYFRSDSSVTRRGFAANYSSLPNNDETFTTPTSGGTCGGYLDAAYGSVISPNYPSPYPNDAQCTWYIRGRRNQIIKLEFTYIELEYTSGCSYDYIAIYDGPTTNSVLLSKFCNGSDEIFISSSSSMTIYFRSDSSVTRRGFAANYSSLPNNDGYCSVYSVRALAKRGLFKITSEAMTTESTETAMTTESTETAMMNESTETGGSCGGYLDAAYGSVLSPNYPYPYPNNAQCTWYIKVDGNERIKLEFTYIELEYTSTCSTEYIAIYDGPSTNSVLLSKFCSWPYQKLVSSSNSMTIYFTSDSSVPKSGFAANYYTLQNDTAMTTEATATETFESASNGGSCGGYLDAAYGSVLSPNYPHSYPNNAQCTWYIRRYGNERIKLEFTYIELEYTSKCSSEYIAIYDGPSTNSVLLSKFCSWPYQKLVSSSNSMTIYFRSDSSVTKSGFAANYYTLRNDTAMTTEATTVLTEASEHRTTETSETTATGHGSCRYNCGGNSSDCSCDYSCQYYGNCCSDFCDHCSYINYGYCSVYSTTVLTETSKPGTTAETSETTATGHGSCRYNCGGNSSGCSCDYSCQFYGNCCSDFCDHCSYINYGYCSVSSTTETSERITTENSESTSTGQGSCRYNCGGNSSGCSCDYSCQFYGNCCSDFCDHCSYINYGYCSVSSTETSERITTENSESTSTGQGSCRYNCGGNSSGCSCDYSCQFYGNCCSDFCDHCSYINYGYCSVSSTTETSERITTENSESTSTGQGSCRYNCGGNSSGCSCDYSCQFYGNCCSDFCDHCSYINYGYCSVSSTTETSERITTENSESTSTGQGSCRYNCGGNSSGCSCDYSCQFYGNCCSDFCDHCSYINYGYCSVSSTTETSERITTENSESTSTGQGSCRYNCGGNSSGCSCDYSCQFYGNCCSDFCDHCSYINYGYCSVSSTTETSERVTTENPESTSTGQGSCRYNCGGNSSGCSCDYSCQFYGNCCSDFCDHCSYINYGYCSVSSTTETSERVTTENPESTSTGQGSCRYNCGGNSSGCSCDYSCQFYGNCCSDFCDHCSYINYGYCSVSSTTETSERVTTENPESTSTGQGSCRYNCGGNSSGCSCDYSCQFYGNCCSDFCDHCSYINYGYCSVSSTTETSERITIENSETTSRGHGSCRYNCGGNSSGCSCDYSCQFYGNCCSDFCDHCSYINYGYCSVSSTTETSEPTTGHGSCRYNCGGYSSGCSCDYSCQFYGNCCSDFCDHCSYVNYGYCSVSSTTETSEPTTGHGSCRYNCGGYSSGCSCDYSCQFYGNCCSDFCDHCSYVNYGYCSVSSTTETSEPTTGHGSCRYNCGGYSSGCSCDYSCQFYGNCCSDFCDHCSYINYGYCSVSSTTETSEPTTGHGSCRYNCGGYSSGCSCDYSCQFYGNCCSDFCDHCSYINYGYCSVSSTTETSEPTTGHGSCRYNCGGYSSGCSCDYSCQFYGNCCSDFCDHCSYINYGYCSVSSTTETSEPTTGHGSCRYNCGGYSSGCSCDYSCQFYGNCCSDFCDHCSYINYGYCSVSSTTETSEPTTGHGSCRYNCGGYSSGCSCDYSCQFYGNCCSDFCDHCSYINYGYCSVSSTTETSEPTTGHGSCRYNCGGYSSGCSCDYSCQFYGNCCSDFCDHCSYINYGYCSVSSTTETSEPTTGHGSCRYNCGGYSSGCSCDYSCQFYGNCCSDFCDHCSYINYGYCSVSSTTETSEPSTGHGSCRYSCGGYSSGCSCDYSCQFYGNCCSDFCDHCSYINYGYCNVYSTTAQTSGGSCGGYLDAAYGSVLSPNYPHPYPNNAQCTWYIRGDRNQRIKLEFTYIELEYTSGCSYDYIAIYDGPSTNSVLLSKFCHGSNQKFISSSSSMTIYFRSDSSVTRRGFTANFYALPNNDDFLTCSTDYMEAKLSRSYLQLLGFSIHSLYLNDRNCRPTITANDVVFKIPLNRCGTESQGNNGSIIYSNTIRSSPSDTIITRESNLQFNIGCEMQQDTMFKIMYVTNENMIGDIVENVTESGTFNVSMTFYDSPSFTRPVLASPYYVDLRQNLFLQANLHSSDTHLVVFVDTCTASPYNFDWTSRTYDLIKNGCVRDGTYDTFPSPANGVVRFKFSAFKFLNLHSSVYLQCKFVVCKAYDYSSRCYRGCISRQKRATSSSKGSTNVQIGPIELKKDLKYYEGGGIDKEMDEADETTIQSSFPFVLSLLVLVVVVSVLVAMVLKLYNNKQRDSAYEQLGSNLPNLASHQME